MIIGRNKAGLSVSNILNSIVRCGHIRQLLSFISPAILHSYNTGRAIIRPCGNNCKQR